MKLRPRNHARLRHARRPIVQELTQPFSGVVVADLVTDYRFSRSVVVGIFRSRSRQDFKGGKRQPWATVRPASVRHGTEILQLALNDPETIALYRSLGKLLAVKEPSGRYYLIDKERGVPIGIDEDLQAVLHQAIETRRAKMNEGAGP